jgi:REP element-mobilizing transposase RayT
MNDATYHVTSRGLERRDIVRDDRDRKKWLEFLDTVARRRGWRIHAWALMTNHFHLFLRTPQGDLSRGMHDLNAGYVSWFNVRHRRNGPLLQGRFHAVLVERDFHYWELSRYIHLNPVRAGIVARPEIYRWSSCPCYFNDRLAPSWLAWEEVIRPHAGSLAKARREYWRFLADGMTVPLPSPTSQAIASTVLGSAGFVAKIRALLAGRAAPSDVPAARLLRAAPSLPDVEEVVCRTYGVPADLLRRRFVHDNEARRFALYLCREMSGGTAAAIGDHFGGISGQAVSKAVGSVRRQRGKERRANATLNQLEAAIREKFQVTT